jgi:spermidine/putrescine transport system substrate-binding protein
VRDYEDRLVEQLRTGRLTRQQFVRRASAFGLSLATISGVLAACGGDDQQAAEAPAEPPAEAPAATGEPSETTTGEAAAGPVGPATLEFVGWEGYDGKPAETFPTFTQWMTDNELEVSSTYVSNNEEMLTKIKASTEGTYDLTSPYHGIVPTMILADALEPLDEGRLANFASIYPKLTEQEYIRDESGTLYVVPFTFGYFVALYNADRVEPLESYSEVLDNPDLKDRYTLIDAPEHFTWIATLLGLGNPDPHHLTKAELEEVKAVARDVVANAKTLAPAYGDILQLLVSNEVDYSLSGTVDQVDAAKAEGVNLAIFFPKEGTQAYVDNFGIPKGAQDYDAALAWIDQMLTPEAQAEVAQVYSGAVANLEAVPLLPTNLQELFAYDDLDSVFERAPVYPAIPAESSEFATHGDWTKAWEEVK